MSFPKFYTYFYENDNYTHLVIPKNASTSIRHALGNPGRANTPKHDPFVIIRNPIERFVSCYQEMRRSRRYRGVFCAKDDSFDSYMEQIRLGLWDEHQVSQMDYVNQYQQRFDNPLRWFVFEKMEEVSLYIMADIPVWNKSKQTVPDYTKYSVEIKEMYQEDFYVWLDLFEDEN